MQNHSAKFILRLLDSFKTNEEKIAVVDQNGQRQTTYKELFTNACKVACYLQQKNYPPHSFISISLPTSMEYVASEIGIWLAGHAIVPMGDSFPSERIDLIMSHCESPLLIDQEVYHDMALALPTHSLIVPSEDDVNALFYTSGSTGRPKGVTHSFRSLDFAVASDLELMRTVTPLTFGYTSPPYFIACRFYFSVLLLGGKVDFVSTDVINDIRLMEDYIDNHKLTAIFLTPSILQFFHGQASCLQMVLTGSERLSGIGPHGYRLFNIYGQTETFGPLFSFEVEKQYDNTPIGKPHPNVEMLIVDKQGNSVKPGEPGELCLKGDFTLGYFKDEKQTSYLFRDGMLHTNDLVQELPDGNLIYINRQDWMVKINGQRVEPGEVETVIKQIDGVKNAIVKGFTTKNRQFLCAYYIANQDISEDTIRAFLHAKLPTYMVPTFFIRMENFPLLPNGKTDRKSLLLPTIQDEVIIRPPYVEPTNHVECQLCEAFEKVLSVDHVGIDDDFFELGGDSIRVMEIQTLCPEQTLSSQMIYASRTPRKIADACTHTESVIYTEQKDYQLTQTQLGIYVECMSQQGNALYNNAMLFKLAADVDTNRLARACEAAVEAHPYIKTRLFVDEDGHPRQRRNDDEPYHQQVESMTEADFQNLKPQLEQPFLLLSDRLFRIRILKTTDSVYLFIDFHHIIFDGTSMQILLQDMSAAYEANDLQKEAWSGFEVAQEEETIRLTENYSKSAEWNKTVFGALDITSLPIPDNHSDQVSIDEYAHLIPINHEMLEQSCRRWGVTAQVLTTAAFGYLLGTFTHSREALFATVYNGRNHLKSQRTIAMLVKTIAVHIAWNESMTIREWLRQSKEMLLGSMNHDLFSFAELCALNNHVNSEVLFAYQGGFQTSLTINGYISHPQSLTKNATGKSLFVELLPEGQQLQMKIAYQKNLYSESFIRQFSQSYEQILHQLTAIDNETKRLIDLPLLAAAEYDQIKTIGLGQQLFFNKEETLVSLFRKKAKECPTAPALVFKDKRYSYQELDAITDRLAAFMADHYQVKPEETVGVMIDRSDLMVVYPLAIMKAGAAYMPLDYHFPANRLQYMCEDAGVRLILSEGNRVSIAMPDFQGEVLSVEQLQDLPEATTVLVGPKPEQHYVVLYTSGSTGLPKGVALEHHSMVNFCHWYSKEIGLRTDDRVMAYANFGFDCHMLDLFPALTTGACVYVIPSDMRIDLPLLNNYMEEQGITVAFMTTQVGHLFATTIENHSLRVLTVAGEKLMPMTAPSSYTLYNGYGPTECTVFTTYYRLEGNYQRPLIGRPLPNYQLFVVSPDLQPVPQGAVGELIVLGEGLARGYLHPADKDKGKFTMFRGQRCYKTGDLVRWTNSGDLEYLGRMDNQVKLRGLRIELEEIELRALQHPHISQAVACVKEVGGVENLCLYYVSKEADVTIETDELKSFLSEKLVDFMVPTLMMQLESIPMTPNGKINRKALPVPTIIKEAQVAPETEMEKQVLELITEMLKTTQIGVTDNLLHWGLSSLAAMRLSALLQRRFKVYVKMVEVMKSPTVRAITHLLSKASDSSLPVYEPRAYYPLMENQRGLYLEWKKNPDTTQYNIPHVYSFEGIDVDRLVEALEQTVNAHPYLKSRLIEVDGDIFLQPHYDDPLEVKVVELNKEQKEAYLHKKVAYFQKKVSHFHLLNDPLYRFEVLKTPDRTYLFFDVHHIIFDGLSNKVFMNDLKRAYEGETLKKESYQAFDYALYEQTELRNTEKIKEAESWYDELMAGANAIVLPSYLTPDGVDFANIEICLPSHQIDTFCAVNSITVNSFMHAAFAVFVKRLIKEDNPLYLTISNGRDVSANLQQCIGMFVKTMPIVITSELAQGQSTAEFVKEVHEQLQKSYSLDYYPYTKIVSRHRVNAELMFIYQDEIGKNFSWEDLEQIPLSLDTVKFPISIIISPEADTYRVSLEYDGKRYNSQGMRQMVEAFRNVLANMVVTANISDVELISPDETSELLELSRGETIEYDQRETFVDLFKRQVAISPDAIAVVDSQGSITYQELDDQSNILANVLVDHGIAKDDFVGIMLPRCKEFLVAVLGVFKAGGAYIPIDPEYPETHLSYILHDAQTKLLLTVSSLAKEKNFNGVTPTNGMLFIDVIDLNRRESVPVNNSHPCSLAYMIYTSGSTGKPKGVMMEHKGLCALVKWLVPMEELKPGDKCAEHASFSFDASLLDLFAPLTCGAEVHILSSKLRLDMKGMCTYFEQQHITGTSMSTQLGMEMINGHELPLRYMVLGGEKMNQMRKTSVKLINEYGPTEFTVCSSYHVVNQEKDYNTVPIGRPVPNSMSVVVDNMGHLVPKGIPGELCLIGRQMSRGYWKQEEQTISHFTSCPFLEGETMYHTGDMAQWNEDGELVYLGRTDSQVKLNGFRIELGEIENEMMAYPSVTAASVLIYKRKNIKTLVGFFCAEETVSSQAMHNHLRHSLPHFMIPQVIIQINKMPVTPNGKTDKNALLSGKLMSGLNMGEHIPPANKDEKKLYDIAKIILESDDFGVTDDLTLLGLTSLSAIKLADKAHREGLYIKVNDILRNKSIRNILACEQSIGRWENAYDASKPVIVLIQGLTSYDRLKQLISQLCEHYSVFVVEPIDDHFEVLFNEKKLSSNDVVKFYVDYLEARLPSNADVKMFIGHSFGGTLAYRSAAEWQQKTHTLPEVCMLDTFAHIRDIAKEMPMKEWNRHIKQILSLEEKCNLPSYDGNILYFAANIQAMKQNNTHLNEHELEKKKEEDLNIWRSLVPHINIYHIATDHFAMLGEPFCGNYVEKIEDIVSPHNSSCI